MDNKRILQNRLNDCSITIEQIMDKVPKTNDDMIIIYITQFEGLGNKKSDFDIYVIKNQYSYTEEDISTKIVKLEGYILDIEYYSIDQIYNYIQDIDNCNEEQLKLLHKLKTGLLIKQTSFSKKNLEILAEVQLKNYILRKFVNKSNGEYEDAVKMYKVENYECSIMCVRRALNFAVAAYNTMNNETCLNEKWIPHIFIKNEAFGNDRALKGYIKFQIYPQITAENIKEVIELMCELTTSLLTEVSFKASC